jgi:hypothetical protein
LPLGNNTTMLRILSVSNASRLCATAWSHQHAASGWEAQPDYPLTDLAMRDALMQCDILRARDLISANRASLFFAQRRSQSTRRLAKA